MKSTQNAPLITIDRNPKRVVVSWNGRTVADTRRALSLREGPYPAVQYIPREDADMALLQRSAHTTHCPHKGSASYYSLAGQGGAAENAVWTYESPREAVAPIKDHLAFYPDRVSIEERD